MLGSIRKFSSSIYAKVFLVIVAIPFIFWGMGPVFQGGKQNTIAEIGKNKISTTEFINYINSKSTENMILDDRTIEKLLSSFIGEKLMSLEIDNYNIKLSDNSLSAIIKNNKSFIKDKKFSRTKYEKFLIENNLNAVTFENNISELNKKEHLFSFIGGGIMPSYFIINFEYNKLNQKRSIDLVDLNDVFKKNIKYSENDLISYFEKNKDKYINIQKKIEYIKLTPDNLTGNEEFTDLFFKKLDEIDDLIIEGQNLNYILKKYDLRDQITKNITNPDDENVLPEDKDLSADLIKKVFKMDESDSTVLVENNNHYYVVQVIETINVQKDLNDEITRKMIKTKVEEKFKRKIISEIIGKINNNKFNKPEFDKFAKNQKIEIKKIKINSSFDDKILNQKLVNQIYKSAGKRAIVIADIGLKESYLVYINKIENTSLSKKSKDYDKYLDLSQVNIKSDLFMTYDEYLKNKYEISINYKALNRVNNYFQ